MIGTPSNLELLLHCFYSPEPHPRYEAPAIQEGIAFLLRTGMIKQSTTTIDPDIYDVTEKGDAYIDYLMKVPFPVAQWIIPERNQAHENCN